MAYVLPQVLVFQEFTRVPAAVANPLRAHISGPHAFLARFDESDEKDLGKLGFYDNTVDTAYTWPNRPTGAKVDEGYTKLFAEKAILRYYDDQIGASSVIKKVAGFNNRIRSETVNFRENGTSWPRDSAFFDRDVKDGDIVKLISVADGQSKTTWTYVKDVVGDTVSSVIGTASHDSGNQQDAALTVSVNKISGADNCIVPTADGSSYDGLKDGNVSETYDIIVTQGSVDGDFTQARLRILSASGNDDDDDVKVSAKGVPTSIGSRGLTVTFDVDPGSCSISAADDSVPNDELVAGQRWQVFVQQEFKKSTPNSGGTYTNQTDDTTYIIEVTRGGRFTDSQKPQISVTTTTGVDISGPTDVPDVSTDVVVGTRGVTISFTGIGTSDGLRKGDKFYITVTGEKEGAMRTLVLGHNLPDGVADDSEVGIELFILKDSLEIPKNREGFAPLVNWSTSSTEITVKSGIVVYDSSWTDNGVQQPLDLHADSSAGYTQLFVHYRAWRSEHCYIVRTIDDVANIDDIEGSLHPDNPLKWGVFKALENANGTEVKYTAVCDPDDEDEWQKVIDVVNGRDDIYNYAPLTRNQTVLGLFAAHVDSLSTPEEGLWRGLFVNLEGKSEIPVVHAGTSVSGYTEPTTTDGNTLLCVIEDDPDTSGTQYTILRSVSSNGAFITNGVKPGHTVRTLFAGDGFGNFEYQEFEVDEVISEDQIRLKTGPSAAVTTGVKTEIWNKLDADEESAEIAKDAGAWNNRRVCAVWPDKIESSGTVQEGYFLCAALAGLVSGVLPHQGLTRLAISGFTDVPRTVDTFNKAQLDVMAESGTWIVTQDVFSGDIFTRHAVTTGNTDDINEREEMVRRNVDSISYRFKSHFEPFIGVANVTSSMEAVLHNEILSLVEVLRTESATTNLGGQLIDATINRLSPHVTLKDRFVVDLDVVIPYALNNLSVKLVI